jgi:hypothetical protein
LFRPFAEAQNSPPTWRTAAFVLNCVHILAMNRPRLRLCVADRLAIPSLFGAHVSHAEEAKV